MAIKMQFRNQVLLVNICIFAGLIFQYFRGMPILIVVGCGVFLLLMVNIIFLVRAKRVNKV